MFKTMALNKILKINSLIKNIHYLKVYLLKFTNTISFIIKNIKYIFVVTALVVRFITRRYIGEYDPTLEKVYTFHTLIDNEMVYFEILDTAGQPHVSFTVQNVNTLNIISSKKLMSYT